VNQLLADQVKSAGAGNPILKHSAYAYDLDGNRTGLQENGAISTSVYNNLNQVTSQVGGGKMRFLGGVDEAAVVTVDGNSTPVSSTKRFDGSASVRTGLDTVAITAKDYSNNSRTNKYQVATTGSTASFAYDNNGNMTGDGTRTFEWDAENRLTAINIGTLRSEFTYDGFSRRVRIVEKSGATVTSDKRFLWVGNGIAEERDATGGTATKRYFQNGVQVGTAQYFYTRDHLGSIKEMTDNSAAVMAEYGYDPYGMRTRVSGTLNADFGFTGHYFHAPSGLYLAKFRVYNPGLGRWISRDPYGSASLRLSPKVGPSNNEEASVVNEKSAKPGQKLKVPDAEFLPGGANLYEYVGNNGINAIDPLGLWYIDFNITGGWFGLVGTGGVFVGSSGIHPYAGGGIGTPGISSSAMYSPGEPSPGCWSWQVSAAAGVGGAFGGGPGGSFTEVGGGWPPGASFTGFYTW
jgi:RHS repeat-associated protein